MMVFWQLFVFCVTFFLNAQAGLLIDMVWPPSSTQAAPLEFAETFTILLLNKVQ